MTKQKVAFFDIDGTIFRSSLLIELVEELIVQKVFEPRVKDFYLQAEKKWLDRKGDYSTYIMAVVEIFMKEIKGVGYGDFKKIGKRVVAEQKNHTYVYTRELVKKLRAKNYYLVALSQSPKVVLDDFCRHLGFDKVYGRIYPVGPTGKFTGEVDHEHLIANKANIVKRVVDRENVTLVGSYAVGDTEGDISMLELVENPICFNPNQKLYRSAKRMGWKTIVERKDVIYEIK